MTAEAFIAKWSQVDLTERSAAQQHFLDLCELVGHPKPADADPAGDSFTFEKGAAKHGGGDGWADVWKKDFFGWEYKGRHKDLAAAYDQLLEYRADLDNPPLLVVCDLDIIRVHTNFNNAPTRTHELNLATLGQPRSLEILDAVFHAPDKLRPGVTSEAITEKASGHFAEIAGAMRQRGLDPQAVAHFLVRVVFCLFAEDVGLLERGLFTRLVTRVGGDPKKFARHVADLFSAMATGGDFLLERIRHFNGSLFDATPVLELTADEIAAIGAVAGEDWSAVDVSISGTLFERGLNPAKRSQLGSHYTSRAHIETIVEPVVLAPLRREWTVVRGKAEKLLNLEPLLSLALIGGEGQGEGAKPVVPGQGTRPTTCRPGAPTGRSAVPVAHPTKKSRIAAERIVLAFLERLKAIRVLDPAGGSGNFLYVTLQKLLELEKEVNHFLREHGFTPQFPQVNPLQLHCLEIDPYAHDLAQTVVWIGYIQWLRANGYGFPAEPILKRMSANFRCADALFTDWPDVDFIVSNPPFLGGSKLRTGDRKSAGSGLGDEYVEKLFAAYRDRVPGFADLCCYWFEKARQQIEEGKCKRAGLLATQGIRGGANREVLKRIKETGDIFFAESDRPWILAGAAVNVSMIGFDDGSENNRLLDGVAVTEINANLTAHADTPKAQELKSNTDLCFYGSQQKAPFDIGEQLALEMLHAPNPHGLPNSDVVRPSVNASQFVRRGEPTWVIDFGLRKNLQEAASYELPIKFVRENVLPLRTGHREAMQAKFWWLHARPSPRYREVARGEAVLITPAVAKHRVFGRFAGVVLADHALIVYARADDFFFGVLQSRFHEVWALKLGTRLETRPRYTPTTCFETFPFPRPTPAQEAAIAAAAQELNALRERWLNPPEWMETEYLEFPASVGGSWDRYIDRSTIHEVGRVTPCAPSSASEARRAEDCPPYLIGTVRYPRLVPKDTDCAAQLKKRTLTNLYNERPAWLDLAHKKLDAAVAAAYGWPADLSDEQILERLLGLNLERAAEEAKSAKVKPPKTPREKRAEEMR